MEKLARNLVNSFKFFDYEKFKRIAITLDRYKDTSSHFRKDISG